MNILATIALVCSHLDADIVIAIATEAPRQSVPVELVLAVGCVESGLQGRNPLGVMVPSGGKGQVACHRSGRFDTPACITIGVRSLANRLVGCGGDTRCAARRYNASAGKIAYAAKVVRIVRFLQTRSAK